MNGTGKSVFARFLHQNSSHQDRAFVTVSCPSLSAHLLASELFGHVKGRVHGRGEGHLGEGGEGGLRHAVPGRDRSLILIQHLFSAIVIMAIATTVLMPIGLRYFLGDSAKRRQNE
mgnify:CR=1 FL=1